MQCQSGELFLTQITIQWVGIWVLLMAGEIPSLVMDQQISCLLVKLRVKSVSQQTKKVRCSKMVRMGQGNA